MTQPKHLLALALLLCPAVARAQSADAGAPDAQPPQLQEVTVVGTRERQTAGSAHIVKEAALERFEQDNPEAVLKTVPGVYSRGEDGFGLRPNVGLRGASPERSRKVTLMEDGVLFAPAPYAAPAAYYYPLITRMQSVRVIKGPGAVVFGPQTVGGAVDFITRGIPAAEAGGADLAAGQYGYGKLHGHYGWSSRTSGFLVEGIHVRSDGFKRLDTGGDTGFERNEWMVKGRRSFSGERVYQELSVKGGYSSEDSRETYLGLSDDDFHDDPLRRYGASRFDRMRWHRTTLVLRHLLDFGAGRSVETTAYRHDFDRTWRKVNRFGDMTIGEVLGDPSSARNAIYASVLRGESDSSTPGETIFIGPNQRRFVSEGVQSIARLRLRGALDHRVEGGVRLHYDRIERLHTEDGFLMRGGQLVSDGRATIVNANERVWALALAAWAADAVSWKRLTVTPGLRTEVIQSWERNRLTGQNTAGGVQSVVIPGVGAFVTLAEGLGVLAGVHRGFSPAAAGQPGAVAETSWNYEAGARFTGASVRLETIGFFNDYRNLTSVCSFSSGCSEQNVDRQYDAGRARIYGLEAFGELELRAGAVRIPTQASYTFTHTELLEEFISDDPQLAHVLPGYELPYVPRHQLQASVGAAWGRFAVYGEALYVSATREVAGDGAVAAAAHTDQSLVFDASAHARVWSHLSLYLQVRNLLDRHDVASRRPFGARPVAPRWIQLGAKLGF